MRFSGMSVVLLGVLALFITPCFSQNATVDCSNASPYLTVYKYDPCVAIIYPKNCPERLSFNDLPQFLGPQSVERFPNGCTFYISQFNTSCFGDECFKQREASEAVGLDEYVYTMINMDIIHSNSVFLPAFKGSPLKFKTSAISADYVGQGVTTCASMTFVGSNITVSDIEIDVGKECYEHSLFVRGFKNSMFERSGLRIASANVSKSTFTNIVGKNYATAAIGISESAAPFYGDTINVDGCVFVNISMADQAGGEPVPNITLFSVPISIVARSAVGTIIGVDAGNIFYDEGSLTIDGNGTTVGIHATGLFLSAETTEPATSSSSEDEKKKSGNRSFIITISIVGAILMCLLIFFVIPCYRKTKNGTVSTMQYASDLLEKAHTDIRREKAHTLSELRKKTVSGHEIHSTAVSKNATHTLQRKAPKTAF